MPDRHATKRQITALLTAWSAGRQEAFDELLPLVYDELKRVAARYMTKEARGHMLQATALVHEAYLRLIDQRRVQWRNRAHFFAVSASLMRRILVDHARARNAGKRGAGVAHVLLVDDLAEARPPVDGLDLLRLDDALRRLAALDPQQARIVELRYFGGLTIEETAHVAGVSSATVAREWTIAKAWLRNEMEG